MENSNTTTTAAPPTQADPKSTANNIAKGISDRARGRSGNDTQGSQENGSDTKDQKSNATPPADPNAGKEKYVVEGRDIWLTPEQARAYVQKGISFEPRMDQLARLAQEQQQLMRGLITNPGAVLANVAKQNNVPMKDLVQRVLKGNVSDDIKEAVGRWYYEEAVEPLRLSPEELKAREDAKWRQEREEADKTSQQNAIRRENYQKFQQAMTHLKANIAEAMKDSGLPNNDTPLGGEMARLVAEQMRVAWFRREAITPKQAIEHVKRRIKEVQNSFYDSLEPAALVEALGEKNAEKVKNYFLKLVQDNGNRPPVVPNGKPSARNGQRKTLSMDEFHDYLDKRKKEG